VSIHPVTPVSSDALKLAHDAHYVDEILACRRFNGFGNHDSSVALSLPYTTGSLLSAARYAVQHQSVAVSPSSGFHHAGYDYGGGFCTFNGLMVTVLALRKEGLVQRVGILDCDAHYGDGTDDIIDKLSIDYVVHHTGFGGIPATCMREWISDALASMQQCDLVLYQAGADVHIHDPLGGLLSLTTEEMLLRDQLVFAGVRAPIVWNLAGGYQDLSTLLLLHDNTMRACVARYGPEGIHAACEANYT
jgi:acetoin utilization deacetylase AcuC-like enzyme